MQSGRSIGQILPRGQVGRAVKSLLGLAARRLLMTFASAVSAGTEPDCLWVGGANEWVVRSRVRKHKEQVSSRSLELNGRRRKYFNCRGTWRAREGFTYLVFLFRGEILLLNHHALALLNLPTPRPPEKQKHSNSC